MVKRLFLGALLVGPLAAATDDNQAFLAILAETKVQKMAGMPKIELPPGIKLPPDQMAMISGKATRSLHVRLWSPGIAPKDATAVLTPPAGLKVGPKMDLELYRPEAGQTGTKGTREFDPDSNPEFTIKIYWGSSQTVREGQPKVIKFSGLTAEQKETMRQKAREAQDQTSYFYKPDWTTGYWPTKKQAGAISDDASLVGKYALATTYTGNVEIEAPTEVDFLAGIELSSPDLSQKIDFKKFLGFRWTEIPHALGLNASAMGFEGKNLMIMWTSSEVFTEGMMGDMGFLQMAQVREFVANKMFMPGNTSAVDVPAGIFANVDMAMFQMTGYGPGAALDKAQPLPRIQTKTGINVMLGGKKMPGF